ncbi:unnamed protein product [Orchesella dallaii]|uniref:RRM domain-containing protein n=1 Tax=Orchesella dallaii TaxID=48710 RepID=A0ABP1QI11_9HEXA
MVLKGVRARKEKAKKYDERKDKSLFVSFKNPNKLERSQVLEILENAHSDIEHVFLPRQKIPRNVYVVCKEDSQRKGVQEALRKLKNEELGPVFANIPKKRQPQEEKSPAIKTKRVMDPCTLLLEWIPKELPTDELIKEFPEAEKVNRFNPRRCYMHFKTPKAAMKAKIRLTKEKIGGHQVKASINKIDNDKDDTV